MAEKSQSQGRLASKSAIVFGAGSVGPGWGNGKAAAVLFAREGARVACVDVNPEAARETAEIIQAEGGIAEPWAADVTNARQVAEAVDACVERFDTVDIVNNNVGIAGIGGVVELSEESWDRAVAVNLKSCFLTMKFVIPIMQQQGGGAIVNISSIASIRYTGVPYASYYATKAALNHLTRTTAAEYAAFNIRVNAVLPGLMRTPMVEHSADFADRYAGGDVEGMWRKRDAQVPMGHMGDAWDVARAALFLVSDDARYVTGAELLVDGGLSTSCR